MCLLHLRIPFAQNSSKFFEKSGDNLWGDVSPSKSLTTSEAIVGLSQFGLLCSRQFISVKSGADG